jgi:dipeptidyl aminopeptidase/acylaminoacyl peptidase
VIAVVRAPPAIPPIPFATTICRLYIEKPNLSRRQTMFIARRKLLVIALACFSISSLAYSQSAPPRAHSPMEDVVRTLFAGVTFDQAAISPDGRQVAWVENVSSGSEIHVSDVSAPRPRRITAGGKSESGLAWSPDGKQIAFLSDAVKPGQQQLYIASAVGGGTPRKLTSVSGFLASPGWSPDGKTIALLFTENAERAAGPLVAEKPQTGVIKEAVTEQRLSLVDVATGRLRQISPPDMYVYEYDWSHDGKRFVATAAHGNGDNNWYIAQIYTIAAAGGEMKSIYKPPVDSQIAVPAWSPDGRSVAFISGLMSDEPSVGGDIFVVPSEGGEARNVTPGMKASASWLTWLSGAKILFGEEVDGESGVASVDLAAGNIETLFHGPEHLQANGWGTMVSLSADNKTTAVIRQSFAHPPEVWAGAIGQWKQITSRNAGLKPAWGEARSIHWQNDGFNLQGWLLYPRNFDAGKKYPMVVQVHGGPGSMAHSSWPGKHSFGVALSASGYFVFMPNPRGSFGQGEVFTRANVKDFGYGDFRDIMGGVDQVLKEAPVDEHRLGITGWSYGGYMTMWAVTQTRRFAAAVAGAGLANFQSYYGENQIDQWMVPFFGATVYDDPQVYAKSSPITFIKNAKTPTLVLVGDSDGECPTPQSYEFWHALKTLGVETELVVYEHEGHMFADPEHQRDVIERVAAWFDRHLK